MPARNDSLAAAEDQVAGHGPADLDMFDQQVNVRMLRRRVNQMRRLAASRGESMQEFFDRLVLAEVEREQEILMREFEEEERRAREAREQLRRELDQLAAT